MKSERSEVQLWSYKVVIPPKHHLQASLFTLTYKLYIFIIPREKRQTAACLMLSSSQWKAAGQKFLKKRKKGGASKLAGWYSRNIGNSSIHKVSSCFMYLLTEINYNTRLWMHAHTLSSSFQLTFIHIDIHRPVIHQGCYMQPPVMLLTSQLVQYSAANHHTNSTSNIFLTVNVITCFEYKNIHRSIFLSTKALAPYVLLFLPCDLHE